MPATRTRVTRGSTPIGDSRPCGEVTVTTSPTPTLSASARALPEEDRRRALARPVGEGRRAALATFATTSVTVRSSAGTMPLRVAAAAPVGLVRSALP